MAITDLAAMIPATMDSTAITTGLATGFLLGAVHLAGLWLTVRALPKSPVPGLLLIVSFAARIGLVVAGAALVAGSNWQALAAVALGFLTVRIFITRAVAYHTPVSTTYTDKTG